jgi:hypothetical protein
MENGTAAFNTELEYIALQKTRTHRLQLREQVTFWELVLQVNPFWNGLQ